MAETRQNTIIGIFVAVGLVVLCALVFVFGGGRSLFTTTYDIKVWFRDGVEGVQEGQSVTLNGKRIGQTVEVRFHSDSNLAQGVDVIVAIEDRFDIPKSSEVIVPENIMGIGRPLIQLVVTDPDDRQRLGRDGNAEINGRMMDAAEKVLGPGTLDEIRQVTRTIDALAVALQPAAVGFARLLESRDLSEVDLNQVAANLDSVIQRFDTTLRNFNAVLGSEENQANIRATLANLSRLTEAGVAMLQEVTSLAGEGTLAMRDVRSLMKNLSRTGDDLSAVLKHADQALVALNDGDGTLPLMLRDNRLYEALVVATRRLTNTLDDLRELMERVKDGKVPIKLSL